MAMVKQSQEGNRERQGIRIVWWAVVFTVLLSLVMGRVWLGSRYYVISRAEKEIETMLLQHKGVHHYVQRMPHPILYSLKVIGEVMVIGDGDGDKKSLFQAPLKNEPIRPGYPLQQDLS